jgi:hypothetical protein
VPGHAEEVVIQFQRDERVAFALLWDAAPKTCAAVTDALPFNGMASHGTCSGPAGVVFLEQELPVWPENSTTSPSVGELLFTYYPPGWRRGYPEHTTEIYWFHGPGGRPTVPGLFVPAMASVFARHAGPIDELTSFCRWSALLHREGWKPVAIEAH